MGPFDVYWGCDQQRIEITSDIQESLTDDQFFYFEIYCENYENIGLQITLD